jgi:4-hydroxybenzoate polyprenyltransferase
MTMRIIGDFMNDLQMKYGLKEINALIRLIRLPNLLIIILTQFLLRYAILHPFLYGGDEWQMSPFADFLILVSVTVLIALGGYVINDYFDIKIDRVNKPDKVVVNSMISPRGAIKIHMLANILAIALGFYLSYRIKVLSFGLIFPFISGLLWFYSAKYKRMLFVGNIIVALLSAFVILIIWLFEFFWLRLDAAQFSSVILDLRWVTKVFLGYATFAFLVSLFREVIKDMEDCKGDETLGCRTVPLVFGMSYARYIVAGMVLATMLVLGYAQLILLRLNWPLVFWYFLVAVQVPSVYLIIQLFRAKNQADYHFLSNVCKLIMFAGLLSMQLITISN